MAVAELTDARSRMNLAGRRMTPGKLLESAMRWRTFSIELLILTAFIFMAIFAEQIATHDPAKPDYTALLQPPTSDHLFGTDDKGRDIFTRVIYGSRVSIKIALISVGLAIFFLVLALNLVGDGIRDIMDPRRRQR